MAENQDKLIKSMKFNVSNEQQFLRLIRMLNAKIMSENQRSFGCTKELYNEEYLLKRYRAIQAREDRRKFIEKHDCNKCTNMNKRICMEKNICPLDDVIEEVTVSRTENKCSNDVLGNCPYANESGTCFGACIRNILNKDGGRNG